MRQDQERDQRLGGAGLGDLRRILTRLHAQPRRALEERGVQRRRDRVVGEGQQDEGLRHVRFELYTI
jgi:hypothetical protein